MNEQVKHEGKEPFERKGLKFEPGKTVEIDRPFAPGDWRYIIQKGCALVEDVAEAISEAVTPKPAPPKPRRGTLRRKPAATDTE